MTGVELVEDERVASSGRVTGLLLGPARAFANPFARAGLQGVSGQTALRAVIGSP